jgi:hypothetical protein
MKPHEQGLVARLTSQLTTRGVNDPHSEAIAILKARGHLDSAGNLTVAGLRRQNMGAEGRAKDRAAKASGRVPSDFVYSKKTNRATLK